MHPEIDLRSVDFRGLSPEQHADYSDLARRWSGLADEIEHALASQNQNRSLE